MLIWNIKIQDLNGLLNGVIDSHQTLNPESVEGLMRPTKTFSRVIVRVLNKNGSDMLVLSPSQVYQKTLKLKKMDVLVFGQTLIAKSQIFNEKCRLFMPFVYISYYSTSYYNKKYTMRNFVITVSH